MAIDTEEKTRAWLKRFGYLLEENPTPADVIAAVKKMQRVYRLEEEGDPDPITRRAMGLFRCSQKDANSGMADPEAIDAPVVAGTKCRWKKNDVSFAIATDFDLGIDRQATFSVIRKGFFYYEPLTGITFRESTDYSSADIQISAAAGKEAGFDGVGNILALSNTPYGSVDKQLKTIIDAAEPWVAGSGVGVILLSVWMHELGHLCGLNHSANPDDLMSPYYTPDILYPQRGDKHRLAGLYDIPYVETKDADGRLSVGAYAMDGVLVVRHAGGIAINIKDLTPA
jgi:hypothetical protein